MAHRSTEYRRKLKLEDPASYQIYLEKARERNKKNRDNLKQNLQKKNPDKDAVLKKKHQLELQRNRQILYKEKERLKEPLNVKVPGLVKASDKKRVKKPQHKPETSGSVQSRKEYNRIKKQEER